MSFPGPSYMGLAAAVVTLLAVSDTAADASATIAWPAGIQAGDVAVLFDHGHQAFVVPTSVVPTGFTAAANSNVSGSVAGRGIISYRKCDGTETGNITGMSVGTTGQKRLVIFRKSTAVATITPGTFLQESIQGDPALQTVAASGGTPPLIVLAMAAGSNSTTFSTATPAFDSSTTSSDGRMSTGYKIYTASPVNHSVDMGAAAAASCLISGYLAPA